LPSELFQADTGADGLALARDEYRRRGNSAAGNVAPQNRLAGLGCGWPTVWRMEIKVDTAEWPVGVGLAEHDRDVPVEGEAVPEAGGAILVSGDGFLQQRLQGT